MSAAAPAVAAPNRRAGAGGTARRAAEAALFLGLGLYFAVPMIAVLLYSLATRWTAEVLPEAYTLTWWQSTLADPEILAAFQTTLVLATLTAAVDVALVVPAAYWARVRNPRIRPLVETSAAIPFALPYLVIGFALLQFSGIVAPGLQGTFPLVVLGHCAIAFPFVYWAVDGSMAAAGIERLSEAGETCGAPPWQIVRRIVFPNITPGIVSGSLLAFATSFGEFALTQMVGRGIYTIPIWSASAIRSYSGESGDFNRLAVVTMISFFVLFVLSAIVVYFNRGQAARLLPGAATVDKREQP